MMICLNALPFGRLRLRKRIGDHAGLNETGTKEALAVLYLQRWHVELDLRNIKTTLGMDILSCKTPEMVEKEMWVYFLAYNLIRLVMAEAALQADLLPRQLSFKHSLQIWVIWN